MFSHHLAPGVVFRPLEPWQAPEFSAHVDRAREHIRPWVSFASRIVDEAGAREMLQGFADRRARDEGGIFGIWVDGELAGGTLFRSFDTVVGVAELGVWLEPSAQGRGLIQAACRVMIDYAFRVRGLHRVEWFCDPRNARSRATASSLGMTYEGTLRSSYVVNGERIDSEVWSILADEWLGTDGG